MNRKQYKHNISSIQNCKQKIQGQGRKVLCQFKKKIFILKYSKFFADPCHIKTFL